eukprot:2729421-Rhodomonas_salina.1
MKSVDAGLNAVHRALKKNNDFVDVLFLSECTLRCVITIFLCFQAKNKLPPEQDLEGQQKAWRQTLQEIRRTARSHLSTAKVPTSALEFCLSIVEVGCVATPDPKRGEKLLDACGKVLAGLAGAVKSWNPFEPKLWKGLLGVFKVGMAEAEMRQAQQVFIPVVFFERSKCELHLNVEMASEKEPAGWHEAYSTVQKRLRELQICAMAGGRWEVVASFVDVVAYSLLGDGIRHGKEEGKNSAPCSIHNVDPEFIKWCLDGEEEGPEKGFMGLKKLSCFGEDAAGKAKEKLKDGSDVSLIAIQRWSSQ